MILFPLLILSLAALVVAIRGRRVDDHPLCRRCGFDLTGRPDSSARCPECGADLSAPRVIRMGHRAPRRGLAIVAGLLLLVSVLGIAWTAARSRNLFDPTPCKPVSWLVTDALSGDPVRSNTARAELLRRLQAKSINAAPLSSLTKTLLARQADLTKPFATADGDLIESLHTANGLTAADWDAYCRNAVVPVLAKPITIAPLVDATGRAHSGYASLQLDLRLDWRTGSNPPFGATLDYEIFLDGRSVSTGSPGPIPWIRPNGGVGHVVSIRRPAFPAEVSVPATVILTTPTGTVNTRHRLGQTVPAPATTRP